MSDFLPPNYELPQSTGKYFKPVIGENRLRILGKPIVGNVGWHEDASGKKPVRQPSGAAFQIGSVDPETIKHFWAMPVWNYRDGKIQVWELTQKTIMAAIQTYAKDGDWGDPTSY